jgi:hypothetical protein
MTVKTFKQRGRVVRYVARAISYVICFALGVAVGSDKLKLQRNPPAEDDRTDKWLPMSQAHDIFPDPTIRILAEEHVTVTKRVTMGSLNGTSDTNMVTVYMRKWPVFGISDHITVMLYGKISLGTNLVSVGMYKDGMWTVSDQNEKPLDDEAGLCTNVVTAGSLKGGIWTEADNFVRKLLSNEARIDTNLVPVDVKPASAKEE